MSYFGNNNPRSAYGELETIVNEPVVQVSAQYGVLNTMLQITVETASITSEDSMFTISTGTGTNGTALTSTRKQMYSKAGQGAVCVFDALFDTPVANSRQYGGLINSEDGICFAYLGEEFGVLHFYQGKNETLLLTIDSGGTGSATVTVNDIAYPVTLTAGGANHNAYEIAQQLSGVIPNYFVTSNQNEVTFMCQLPVTRGSFSFTGSNATTTFTREITGAEPTRDFTPQADWNGLPSDVNPQLLNNYKIVFDGNIYFYIQNSETGNYDLVHTIKYTNSNTVPPIGNPTFRGGWYVTNDGNNTNLTVKGSKMGIFCQGMNKISRFNNTLTNSIDVGATETVILSLRNRFEFNGRINRSSIYPTGLSISTDSAKGMVFKVYTLPVYATEVIFDYINKTNSIAEFSLDSTTLASFGAAVRSYGTANSDTFQFELGEIEITPDTLLAVTVKNNGNSSDTATLSVTWSEDL